MNSDHQWPVLFWVQTDPVGHSPEKAAFEHSGFCFQPQDVGGILGISTELLTFCLSLKKQCVAFHAEAIDSNTCRAQGGAGPCRVALLEEGEVVLIGLGNSSSWIPVLDFRPTCERGQWFSIDTFAESCVRAGLERV